MVLNSRPSLAALLVEGALHGTFLKDFGAHDAAGTQHLVLPGT
jgi:hypothetical protein